MNLTRPPLVQFGAAGCLAASGSVVVALLLLITCAAVARLAAAALAAGALVGFILSRTVGVLGFVEYGLQPAPQALISVLVEIATLALLAGPLLPRIAAHPNRSTPESLDR